MKCLRKYKWVKIPRDCLPKGKGIMGHWARLSASAAFRNGIGVYCGHHNHVVAGIWKGGIVGLKSILGARSRQAALAAMEELTDLGYIAWELDPKMKKLTYQMKDWLRGGVAAPSEDSAVYATEGYGFLCIPRNITERLIAQNRILEEADAWLDLWCHTVYRDYGNAFSFLAPAIQYGRYGAVLTLEFLGQRWGWEKTKVWRFFQKNHGTFSLYRLPGAFGCVIMNRKYPTTVEVSLPEQEEVERVLGLVRSHCEKRVISGSDWERGNRMIAWYSGVVVKALEAEAQELEEKGRIAVLNYHIRAYFSHGKSCKNYKNWICDCPGAFLGRKEAEKTGRPIRGPCGFPGSQMKMGKEWVG